MKDDSWSWSKPDNIPNLAGRKKVDISLIDSGSTGIPQQFHEEFSTVQRLKERQLDSNSIYENIILVYEGNRYHGKIERRPSNRIILSIKDVILKEKIQNVFKNSKRYILEKRKTMTQEKKYVVVPDELAEYIEFYATVEANVYELRFITNNGLKELVDGGEEIINQSEEEYRDEELDIECICQYLKSKGMTYSYETLSNFYLSLKSKPFTILAGISGTGKSKLVRLFAEAIGADFTLIPVKPDWSDATDLLGYRDLNQTYHMGKFIEVIRRAQQDLDKPYIICLDEMNLARVEYYFSDFLSLIESRRWSEDGRIITDAFSGQDVDQYSIPENVYIVGTVNMDETTFQFSKKVLDRANTIELSEVDLAYDFEETGDGDHEEDIQPLALHNGVLRSQYLVLKECHEQKALATQIINQLIEINTFLKPCGLQFAYRVRDEIVFYMIYNEALDLMTTEEAFDFQILQKILPRINGTSERIRKLIVELLGYCIGKTGKVEAAYTADEIESLVEGAIYPKSAHKLLDMLRRYDEDGFTSFWF